MHPDFPGLTGVKLLAAVRSALGVKGGKLDELLTQHDARVAPTLYVQDGNGGFRAATEAEIRAALEAMAAAKKAAA